MDPESSCLGSDPALLLMVVCLWKQKHFFELVSLLLKGGSQQYLLQNAHRKCPVDVNCCNAVVTVAVLKSVIISGTTGEQDSVLSSFGWEARQGHRHGVP